MHSHTNLNNGDVHNVSKQANNNKGNVEGASPDPPSTISTSDGEAIHVGTMNGYPLYYVRNDGDFHGKGMEGEQGEASSYQRYGQSTHFQSNKIRCVGDSYQEKISWIFRSCEYKDNSLCYSMDREEFFVRTMTKSTPSNNYYDENSLPDGWKTSSRNAFNTLVDEKNDLLLKVNAHPRDYGIGPICDAARNIYDCHPKGMFYPKLKFQNKKHHHQKIKKEKEENGAPSVSSKSKASSDSSYFMIDATILPFQRYKIGYRNPGHHFWQDLVSIYTLLDVFDFFKDTSDSNGDDDVNPNLLLVLLRTKDSKAEKAKYYRYGASDMLNKMGAKLMMGKSMKKTMGESPASYFERYNGYWSDGDFEIKITKPEQLSSYMHGNTKNSKRMGNDASAMYFNGTTSPVRTVCARYGIMGLGQYGLHAVHFINSTHERGPPENDRVPIPLYGVNAFTVNGTNQTGTPYAGKIVNPMQHGKGGLLRRFRSFMMDNVNIHDVDNKEFMKNHHRILFSLNSSTRKNRSHLSFRLQMDYLSSQLENANGTNSKDGSEERAQRDISGNSDGITRRRHSLAVHQTRPSTEIEGVTLHKLSIEEQVQLLSTTKVLLTATGGGTATSIFLPKGSHLILFYDVWFLDWDYWNNMAHITVHWIPIDHLDDPKYLEPLYQLILDCLRI